MKKLKAFIVFPFVILAVIVALYHGIINNEFSGLDDQLMIEEKWDELSHFSHVYTAFTDDVFNGNQGTYYRPIQIISYMPDAFIELAEKPKPQIFFVINIVFFALNALLIFFFLSNF